MAQTLHLRSFSAWVNKQKEKDVADDDGDEISRKFEDDEDENDDDDRRCPGLL